VDYKATLAYLDEVQTRGIKLGLENMHRLLADMGDPQQAFASVVVAGTNGKGSVCAFVDSILRCAGCTTGMYTSPHLVRYEERIAVNGALVSPLEFAAAITDVRERIEALLAAHGLGSHPTHFEVLTAVAFRHFRERAIRYGVLEVGMGGRLDAVATARTQVAVLTNVTLEHTRFLGDTVEAIAREKAGIIREGCWVVTSETKPEALAVIRAEAAGRGVHIVERHSEAVVTHSPSAAAGRFVLSTRRAAYGELVLPLAGRHQVENATLAVLAAEALAEADGLALTPAFVSEGLARTQWPGRLQIVGENPFFLLDGAHNPAACESLARALRDLRDTGTFRDLTLVFGALQDKDVGSMLSHIVPLAQRVVLTRGRSERFLEPGEVAAAVRDLGVVPVIEEDLAAAVERARADSQAGDAVCLCGSLYLVGDAMSLMGIEPYRPAA